jgi:hypothetical protein
LLQVALGANRETGQIVEAAKVSGTDLGGSESLAVIRNPIGRVTNQALERPQLIAPD